MSQKPEYQRSRKFVDRPVQGAIIGRVLTHWIGFQLVAFGSVLLIETMWSSLMGTQTDVWGEFRYRSAPVLLAICLLGPFFLWDLCQLTNRFAGPMVRLRRGMRDVAEGRKVAPIRFRKGDFWQEVAEEFNGVLARIEQLEARSAPPSSDIDEFLREHQTGGSLPESTAAELTEQSTPVEPMIPAAPLR